MTKLKDLSRETIEDMISGHLHIAWLLEHIKDKHNCGKEFKLDVYDFDGRTLWVNKTCDCGHRSRLCFQLIDQDFGEWSKKDETGAVKLNED
ncbi:MAG: hypothetical protein KAS32_31405 [Candidatus Peribacteraceae bacterium]|nr:hypothetical protein [Candidatus Peribacteraceae bacterium]